MVLEFKNNGFLNLLVQPFWNKRLLGPHSPRGRNYEKFDKFIGFILKFWL